MLSRRLIRIKVMQALYAFFQTEENSIPVAEKQLISSIDRIYELYITLLALLVELFDYFGNRADDARHKFLPQDEDLNPNIRFIENQLISQLKANSEFTENCRKYKINWAAEPELLRHLYNEIRAGKEYQVITEQKNTSFDDDCNLLLKLIRNYIFPNNMLQSYLEERNIHWADDYDTALVMVIRTIKSLAENGRETFLLPKLYENEENEKADKDFAKMLFIKTVLNNREFTGIISERTQNWEVERIAVVDTILMKMALSEFMFFPSIPVKATLNEYIEISKEYSTPKSKNFINGLLDKIIIEFKNEGKIVKTGRGLKEN